MEIMTKQPTMTTCFSIHNSDKKSCLAGLAAYNVIAQYCTDGLDIALRLKNSISQHAVPCHITLCGLSGAVLLVIPNHVVLQCGSAG